MQLTEALATIQAVYDTDSSLRSEVINDLSLAIDKWKAKQNTAQLNLEGLSNSQALAFQAMLDFLASDEQFFRLQGYAGTGKSYTIACFVKYLVKKKINICIAAPTHKALKNLVAMLEKNGLGRDIDFTGVTLAKLLGKSADINFESGKEEFVQKKEVSLSAYDVVIVDEFSMINEKDFVDLVEEVVKTKVIFVGDPAQLPPVNEKLSLAAIHSCIKSEVSLSEIMRYDGDIAKVAEEIRSNPLYQKTIYKFQTTGDKTIQVLSESTWFNYAVELFASDEWQENPDLARVIAWRNVTVNKYNQAIRQRLYGQDVPDYIVGDRLISRSPIFQWSTITNDWEIKADNSSEFTIIEPPCLTRSNEGWDYYAIKTRTETGNCLNLAVLTPQSLPLRDKKKKQLSSEAKALKEKGDPSYKQKWKQFFDLDKKFDNVVHSLCLTAHSAQGSSLDHVFLYAKEMAFCTEKQQILYTSLTRAKSACFVCQ